MFPPPQRIRGNTIPITPTPTRKLRKVAIICFWMFVMNEGPRENASVLRKLCVLSFSGTPGFAFGGAGGGSRTHTGREALRIFIPAAAFAARARRGRAPACGLWSGLSLHRLPVLWGLGAARLVSTPSRRKFPSRLGSGLPSQVSPNLGSSASPVSRRALKFS